MYIEQIIIDFTTQSNFDLFYRKKFDKKLKRIFLEDEERTKKELNDSQFAYDVQKEHFYSLFSKFGAMFDWVNFYEFF